MKDRALKVLAEALTMTALLYFAFVHDSWLCGLGGVIIFFSIWEEL